MTFWRPAHELRGSRQPWWSSDMAQSYGAAGLASRLIARCLGGLLFPEGANDRDHADARYDNQGARV